MEIKDFISNFAAQFDETEAAVFNSNTEFKKLEEWSSLMTLSIIAMVDDEYSITVKGDDIRNSTTIEDLYNIVISRL